MERIFQVFGNFLNEEPQFGVGTPETGGVPFPLPSKYHVKQIERIEDHYLPQIIDQAIEAVNTY